jgi:hypothetical protein
MSNTLAIATVTATLDQLVSASLAASGVGGEARVTHTRPDDTTNLPTLGVNIFLYQVSHNPAWRNADLPTRRADGSLLRRPQTALDLHYLLTFHGVDNTLDQQRLLGAALIQLHANPVLSRNSVRQAVLNNATILQNSDLADQIDLVRLTPADLSLDDLNKLWMMFPDAPYVLSAVYVAGVVLIETADAPPGSALPVLKPCLRVMPFSLASIDSVSPQPVNLSSPPAPTTITLLGSNLDPTDDVTFSTPGVSSPLLGAIEPGTGGAQLMVVLPSGLHAGVNTVWLAHVAVSSSPPAAPKIVSQSNAAAFVLRPSILSITLGSLPGELVAVVSPSVGPQQQVYLLLNQVGVASPLAFALPAEAHATETDTLLFSTLNAQGASIPTGSYLARIRVDDAESMLVVAASGTFAGPLVTIS